jgi:gamma-glutamylcyclotransferase (GGCT)/AIG2-like uncharacterized protein YtfP
MSPQLPFFVYGTLLPGQPNYHLWAGAIRAEQPATLPNGRLYDMAQLNLGHYPMLVEEVTDRWQVMGMVVDVESLYYETVLRTLDMLEDFRPTQPDESFYRRARRVVTLANGEQRVAWVYIGRPVTVAGLEPIPGGNWRAYCAARRDKVEQWWAAGGRVPSVA